MREVVDNIYDKKAAILSQTLHSMAAETTLLRHENSQLKEALLNEKKRRQRSRPLLLEKPADYHGGAIWYSPSKVQQGRDLQAQKDEEKKQKEEAKEANRLRKEQQKHERQIQVEERQRTRQIAKEKKLEIEAQKRAQRKSKKGTNHLNYDSDFEIDLEAVIPPTLLPEEESFEELVEDLSLMEFTTATPARSRRGRKINVPARYRD